MVELPMFAIPRTMQVVWGAEGRWEARCRRCREAFETWCPDPAEAVRRLQELQAEHERFSCG